MSLAVRISANEAWLAQIFSAAQAGSGGVVRRKIRDVERRIGRRALELAVRQKGWHLLECGGQFVIVCSREQLRVLV